MQYNPSTKVGIVGAGAMGCLLGYFFSRAMTDIVLYDTQKRVKDIQNGYRIRLLEGTLHQVHAYATHNSEELTTCNIIFIFVKSYATEEAAHAIAAHTSKEAVLITLQNGLGNKEILEKYFPSNSIVVGTTTIGAYIDTDGIVIEGGRGTVTIGSRDSKARAKVLTLLHDAGLSAKETDRPHEALWKKAIINAAINPLGALARIPNGEIIESKYLRTIQEHLIREAVSVAAKEGMLFDVDELIAEARDVCAKTAQNRCSMLQDIEKGRRTEIDTITGYIIHTAHQYGIIVPYNEVVFALMAACEEQKKTGVAPGIT